MIRLFQIFLFVALVSCNKSTDETTPTTTNPQTGYIRFKINGVLKEYSVNFTSSTTNGNYQGIAKKTAADPKEGAAFTIQNLIETGTNTITPTSQSIIAINSGGGVEDTWLAGLDTPNSSFQFNVTKSKTATSTSKYISATFSGIVINEISNDKATISDGIVFNPKAE